MPLVEIDRYRNNEDWDMGDMHCHAYYEFYYLEKGSRDVLVGNTIYAMKENSLMVIPPFSMHKTSGPAFLRININVSPDYFSNGLLETLKDISTSGALFLNAEQAKQVKTLYAKIMSSYEKILIDNNAEILKVYLSYLVLLIKEIADSSNKQPVNPCKQLHLIVIKIINYIKDNMSASITVKELSEKFYVSEGYVSKLFKKHTDCPISVYILNVKLSAAKQLLRETTKSMEEISYLTGFSSANYFSLIFKKKNSISPMAYRKQFS